MEIESIYLRAIQEIPGKRPGDKYRELNLIAEKISKGTHHGDSTDIKNIPKPLLPIVELETANITKNHEDIVKALKSEDSVIINRVMMMRWFFRGENKNIINIDYFENNVFPFVCLNTRNQIIKKLALNLKASGETKIAEEFYAHLSKNYDKNLSEPLLVACGKSFVLNTVKDNELILSCRIVYELFYIYPDVIISYLKLSKPNEDLSIRNSRQVPINNYSNFLPRLIKHSVKDFIELLEMHDSSLNIKLSNKSTETFLKNNVEVLLNKPILYTQLMPLKVIAAKLTKAQYKLMIFKLLPELSEDFSYKRLEKYMEYYPEKERAEMVIDAYRKAYNMNLLDNAEAIDVNFLCVLPENERVRQARIKLAAEPDWRKYRWETEKAWRCYLPTDESIPSIKSEISKSGSDIDNREKLLSQLFYTCKVNNDNNALLEALRYFTTRHKNEQSYLIFEILNEIVNWFDLTTVSIEHWNIINDFGRLLHVKGELFNNSYRVMNLLAVGIHFNIINNLSIDEKIALIVEINFNDRGTWTILEKYPEYERQCLDAFVTMIPKKYPEDSEIWQEKRLNVVESLVKAMYNFNSRNPEKKSKIARLSLKNYPWLLKTVKSIVEFTDKILPWQIESLKTILRDNEKDLYNEWMPEEERKIAEVITGEALARLSKDPKNILDNCEEYIKKARKDIVSQPIVQRFIRETRWYQEIPIKFVDSCLKDLRKEDRNVNSIVILGLLLEGGEFARYIEPLVPKESEIDTEDDQAKSTYELVRIIPKTINLVNPPVPLSLLLNFCQGDYLNLGLTSLTNTCRRVSVDKIEPFTKTLVDRRVSVKKHGIRMFCLVASIQDFREFLTKLWKTEKHTSIRAVIFEKIYNLFINDPIPETWEIMKNCIADLKIDDDSGLEKLIDLSPIPNRFIVEYIKQLLETLEQLETNGFSAELAAKHVSSILNSIKDPIGKLLTEDFAQELVNKYFCNPNVHPDVCSAGNSYVTNGYLHAAGDKLDQRLNNLCNIYENILKKQWDVPHPKSPMFFPINYLAHHFMADLIYLDYRGQDTSVRTKIMKAILKSFLSVLRPQCDFVSYALLTLGIALKDAKTSNDVITTISNTLQELVDTIGDKIVFFLQDVVKKWIDLLVDAKEVQVVMYDLLERLYEIGTNDSCLLAAKFLLIMDTSKFQTTHMRIINLLRNSCYPDVVSLVYLHVNNQSFKI